jgi:Tfp pilus assembly protein PilF
MRLGIFFAAAVMLCAQPADRAYTALRVRDYDAAIPQFLAAIGAAPGDASLRKDLAYTYLKTGEPVLARDQFQEAMKLDPSDTTAALEYAFLCFETKRQAEARRVFDRLRRTASSPGREIAETAFHNIDDPLAAGIERWQRAVALGADNFSAHYELAALAEQRDELALAATHYERAWRLVPARRGVLVDLGRVWKQQGRSGQANAALLAASRGGEPRAAETARELLPQRYPYVN